MPLCLWALSALSNIEVFGKTKISECSQKYLNQFVIAQWLTRRLATGEGPGSNPGIGDNLLISD